MAYMIGSGKTGPLGVQYDDRDRDAANVRNQATQIQAQQASEARRIAANQAAQDSAAAMQKYGIDQQFAMGTRGQDIGLAQSGTFRDRSAADLTLEDRRQEVGRRAAEENRRRFDLERADGQGARDLDNDITNMRRNLMSRFTGGGQGGGAPSAAPSMGGAMGGMAAGAGMAGGGAMDPVDQALSDGLSDRDMMGYAMAFGGPDSVSSFMQSRGEEKRYAREKAEAKEESDRAAKAAMAELAMNNGDESGYQSFADASGGLFSEAQVRAARQPKRTLASVMDVLGPMAAKFNNQDTQFFGDEPAAGAEEDLLHQVALLTEIFMREVRDPKQAELMAWNALEASLQTGDQGADALSDWGADRSKALMARRPGSSTAVGPVAGRSQFQNSVNRTLARTANPLAEDDLFQQMLANVGTRGF